MPVFKKFHDNNCKIGIWKLTETVEELELQILDSLTDDENQKYSNFKSKQRKCEWLATRILLQKTQESNLFPIIKYSNSCKPFLDTQKIGISHSRNFVAVIVSDTNEVSIDIEKISERSKRIVPKFLSTKEQSLFDIQNKLITTLLWSAKETVYKYYGAKELAFIEKIKISSINFETKIINALLSEKKELIINFNILENNVLTFIC